MELQKLAVARKIADAMNQVIIGKEDAIEKALEIARINGYALVKSNNTDRHFAVYFDYEI